MTPDNNHKTDEYLNIATGEVKTFEKGQNFLKMDKKNMIKMLESVDGKKIKVIIYLLKYVQLSNNTIIKTQREIAKECGISLKTVNATLNKLEHDKLISKKDGAIMVSPRIFYRGDASKKRVMIRDFDRFNNKTSETE